MKIKQIFLAAAFVAASAAKAYAQECPTAAATSVTTAPAVTTAMVVVKTAPKPAVRPFSPDYSHALTPEQMTAAWEAEAARFVPKFPSFP